MRTLKLIYNFLDLIKYVQNQSATTAINCQRAGFGRLRHPPLLLQPQLPAMALLTLAAPLIEQEQPLRVFGS